MSAIPVPSLQPGSVSDRRLRLDCDDAANEVWGTTVRSVFAVLLAALTETPDFWYLSNSRYRKRLTW